MNEWEKTMSQAANNENTNQLKVFLHTVRHYRGWIVLGTVLLSLVGIATVLLMPDRYKATTTILVDPQKVSEKYVSPTVNSESWPAPHHHHAAGPQHHAPAADYR